MNVQGRLHPFLARRDDGRVVIRWMRCAMSLALYVIMVLLAMALVDRFGGMRFRAARAVVMIVFTTLPSIVLLYVAKQHAEGKSARQFSLLAVFAGMTVACVLVALSAADRRADLARHDERARLQEAIMRIVGQGHVRVSSTTSIQVKRPAFDDEDLGQILGLKGELGGADAPITFVDLSDTSVTDQGAARLAGIQSLEYCFFDRTKVTDEAVEAVKALPNLKVLSTWSTGVTPERLLKLSQERPGINIEPKTYLRLKPLP